MKIFVFGPSLTSSYWNNAAPYYRGIYKNLADLGSQIIYAQPDPFPWREHGDPGDYGYAELVTYNSPYHLPTLFKQALEADLVIRQGDAEVGDELLDRLVLDCKSASRQVAFWDPDPPGTLAAMEADRRHPRRALLPQYDYVFVRGGGAQVIERYEKLGARNCHRICNALDSQIHYPVPKDPAQACDLLFIGNRWPDRERKVDDFLLAAAEQAPEFTFALGGEGWESKTLPANIRRLGRVPADQLNRLNCSARMVLNLTREPMTMAGLSPSRRIFEAAGAGACVITDSWDGVETFFEPGCEILVARNAKEIVDLLRTVDVKLAGEIGEAMRKRAYMEHLYASRALEIREILRHPTPEAVPWRGPELKQTA